MSTPRNILFLTNSELGQASVMLAVAAEVALDPSICTHLGSFEPLAGAVPHSVKFHCIPGQSMKEVLFQRGIDFLPMHAPGLRGAVQAYQETLPAVMAPWDPKDYLDIYENCCKLIQDIDPVVIVVDPIFGAASDACIFLNRRHVVLSPNSFKDHLQQEQPGLIPILNFPVIASGYPVPLPYWAIPCNLYLCIRILTHTAASVRELTKARNAKGIPGQSGILFNDFRHDVRHLVPSTADIDYPMYIPSNIIGCGPIIPEFQPLRTVHAELVEWLASKPTIVINMGSHVVHGAQQALEILNSILICIGRHHEIQVLWKLQSESIPTIPASLAPRVRIMPWLPSAPAAILTSTASIIAYVHHGGSNSFHEAIASGVPQVVCPVWLDTYDFRTRVEYLGVGVQGNYNAAPHINGEELARALDEVISQPGAEAMRSKAKKLAEAVGGVHVGRKVAASWVIDACMDNFELKQ